MKSLLVLSVLVILVGLLVPSYAETINFDQCSTSQTHHCYQYVPEENSGNQINSNVHVEIHFPQNGAKVVDGVFDQSNFTHLKENPAVMSVQQIYTTNASPTLNYCPVALYSLNNQGIPEYLNHFYNKTLNRDLTGYVYPVWCHVETGGNPINGDHSIAVPEFAQVVEIVLAIAVLSALVFTPKRGLK